MEIPTSRRQFIKHGIVLTASSGLFHVARASSDRTPIKVAVINCGGQGVFGASPVPPA